MTRPALVAQIVEDLAAFKRVVIAMHPAHDNPASPTPAQIGVLLLIARGGPAHVKDLAERLRMSSSAATQLVNKLVEDGRLTRTADRKDRRRIRLALTPAGSRQLLQAKKRRIETLGRLLEPLSDTELATWHRLQRKIIDHAS